MMFNRMMDYDWNSMPGYMQDMMQSYAAGGGGLFFRLGGIFELVTWVLVIILLVAAIRLLWKKGSK